MDISWKQALIGICTIASIAAVIRPSAFADHPAPAEPAPKAAPAKIVVEKHTIPTQPDGYMSEEQCARVPTGMQVADLVWKYGWPAGDYSFSNFSEVFFYPVHDRRDDKCVIDFDDNKVVSTLYRTS
jgi:hypothetical protein